MGTGSLILKRSFVKSVLIEAAEILHPDQFADDNKGLPLTPLYNFPERFLWRFEFYDTPMVKKNELALEQLPPVLGGGRKGKNFTTRVYSYRIKYKARVFRKDKIALHFPVTCRTSGQAYTDLTEYGCHTQLWDFKV